MEWADGTGASARGGAAYGGTVTLSDRLGCHGTLGGMGFAASALALAARDRWMGWEERTRKRQLHRVVGMSRFLIREGVECRNLASKALGMVLGPSSATATGRCWWRPSWMAAGIHEFATNWIRVGETAGGFAATDGKVAVPGIPCLCLGNPAADGGWDPGRPSRTGPGMGHQRPWGPSRLGDERLSRRLVRSASVQAEAPAGVVFLERRSRTRRW